MWVQSLTQDDLLEEGMATHSSILVWRIPWTEEPGELQSVGSHWVRHDWVSMYVHIHVGTCPIIINIQWSRSLQNVILVDSESFIIWTDTNNYFGPGAKYIGDPEKMLCDQHVYKLGCYEILYKGPSRRIIQEVHILLFLILFTCLLFIFWPCQAACGILVHWSGIEPSSPALQVQCHNH